MTYSREKDPDAVLDYVIDFAEKWLAAGDEILNVDVAVAAGDVVIDDFTEADGVVTAWISGGTVDTLAKVRYRVTTAQGRTDDRTLELTIQER
jgi:hypothetical protein